MSTLPPPAELPAAQRIFKIRRDYNTWVADETLEDYALRYTAKGGRRWSSWRVANTASGAMSFLVLEAIGAALALTHGFWNTLWAILSVGLVIFATGLPICVYAARHGLDMDLLTRGAGFGYLGSTITSLIYASFTFIFFALEGVVLARAIELATGLPLGWAYLLSSLAIIPLVTRGITLISRVQWLTLPVWLLLWLMPFVLLAWQSPEAYTGFMAAVRAPQQPGFDPLLFGTAAAVLFALVMQIGEQVDFLRFLPEPTPAKRWRWWGALIVAGPGWIVPGALKMLGGAFLAHLAMQAGVAADKAVEPTQMYLAAYTQVLGPGGWALAATVLFVIVSQVKINMTNAYAGSLAWSNFFARLTHSHPGRVVWVVFNVLVAVLVMALGVFEALERVLGLYANLAIAWVGALVADLVINKPLGLSPPGIEFKRAHLHAINPVGVGSTALAAAVAIAAYLGAFGPLMAAFAPFLALLLALLFSPLIAWATRGRWYIARSAERAPRYACACVLCEKTYEPEDMAHCPAYGGAICSLCCTLDARCHDRCKAPPGEPGPHAQHGLLSRRVRDWAVLYGGLMLFAAALLALVWTQEALIGGAAQEVERLLRETLLQTGMLFAVALAVGAWWIVLEKESRAVAHEESNRQTALLMREIEAHRATDAKLQAAKEQAESANAAKTRYVTGMTHELRTPLNGILGYAQILQRDPELAPRRREAVDVIRRSGEHLLQLVDGLLDLARIEAGKLKLEQAEVAFPDFLAQIVQLIGVEARAKGLAFHFEVEGRLPAVVSTDAKRLRQVLINLLANAVKFTDQGEVRLRVAWGREIARFEVVDTGIGIPAADLERIFLPFERSASGRSRASAGTGLGLTITHLLTELMGGELTVESRPGAGSTFRVRTYLREVTHPRQAPSTGQEVTGYAGRRRSLLVVDDQPMQRHLLAGLLAPLGFQVQEAASGPEALAVVETLAPDAVLMDVEMPEMNGWETCRALRALNLPVQPPVIMVSANIFADVDALKAWAGCQGFIDKPVLESELLALLGRQLGLEWQLRSHAPEPPPAGPAARPAGAGWVRPGPAERATLAELGRIGHVMAIRRKLDELERHDPALAPYIRTLREPLRSFDLDTYLARVQAEPDDLPAAQDDAAPG